MKTSLTKLLCCALLLFGGHIVFSQGSTEYSGGFKVKLNEEGTKYFRIISWGQFWAQYQDQATDNTANMNLSIRRARVLTFMQLNKKFMILTHFGLNSLNGDNLSPLGRGAPAQLFFHGFWGEYALSDDHAIGAGLHYWNGISRLNSQSTLNFMTLDNNRQSWATIGLSDQFARHLGIYFKGKFGKLQYRLSINEAVRDNLQNVVDPTPDGAAVYAGRRLLGSKDAGKTYAGYLDLNLLDQESNFLPYKVGTYLGSKKVFNIGAGFFFHPNGAVIADNGGMLAGEDVAIFAIDAFYDAPLGNDGSAITAYVTYQNNNYGRNYMLGTTYATGDMLYGHLGYLIPGNPQKTRFQPYVSFNTRTIDAIDDNATRFGIGANAFFTGHHSKLSLEYSNSKFGTNDGLGTITLQAMVYL